MPKTPSLNYGRRGLDIVADELHRLIGDLTDIGNRENAPMRVHDDIVERFLPMLEGMHEFRQEVVYRVAVDDHPDGIEVTQHHGEPPTDDDQYIDQQVQGD